MNEIEIVIIVACYFTSFKQRQFDKSESLDLKIALKYDNSMLNVVLLF
jgi:hypothetical protein